MVKSRTGRVVAAVVVALVVIGVAGAGILGVGARRNATSDRIADGVKIGGIVVGGMTADEAKAALSAQMDRLLPEVIEFRFGQEGEKITPASVGVSADLDGAVQQALRVGREGGFFARALAGLRPTPNNTDVPVALAVDQATLDAALQDLAGRLDHKPRDARLIVEEGKVKVIPEQRGFVMDLEATKAAALATLQGGKPEVIECVGKEALPKVKTSDCQGIDTVLASYKTDYNEGSVDRTHNMSIAIKNISGQVLMPGETLSLNEAIGKRDVEKGYREAPIFANGEITPQTGGGICQIATTVYNAALLTGLDIVERHHHSMPVHYAPAGRDATIYWGQLDLRIKNVLAHPVVFLGDVGGGSVDIKIMGRKEDKVQVEISRSEPKKTPFATKEVRDPALPKGKRKVVKPGQPGLEVTVTRVVTKNGVKGKPETLHTDTYRAQDEEVHVGAKEGTGSKAGEAVDAIDLIGPGTKPKSSNGNKPTKKPAKPSAHNREIE